MRSNAGTRVWKLQVGHELTTHNTQPTPRNTQRRTRRLCCALSLLSSLSSLPCHRFFDRLRWWLWWLSSLPRSLSWWWLRLCCRCITDHNIRSKTTHAKRCQADSLRVRKQVRGMRKTELKRRYCAMQGARVGACAVGMTSKAKNKSQTSRTT